MRWTADRPSGPEGTIRQSKSILSLPLSIWRLGQRKQRGTNYLHTSEMRDSHSRGILRRNKRSRYSFGTQREIPTLEAKNRCAWYEKKVASPVLRVTEANKRLIASRSSSSHAQIDHKYELACVERAFWCTYGKKVCIQKASKQANDRITRKTPLALSRKSVYVEASLLKRSFFTRRISPSSKKRLFREYLGWFYEYHTLHTFI